jgi:hypothetical protein
MIWFWEVGTLVVVGLALRRVMRMSRRQPSASFVTRRRAPQIDPFYEPIASEIETHATILGVSLNDAFDEAKAGRSEAAYSMLSIFASEWNRLTELVQALQQLGLSYLPMLELPVPARKLDADRFRSGTMIEFVRFHAFADQFVFRPKLRFQLHLRLQGRAIQTLNEEVQCILGETGDRIPERLTHTLAQIDLYFHDLDLLAKETILALRAELSCLSEEALASIEVEIHDLVRHGVPNTLTTVNQ